MRLCCRVGGEDGIAERQDGKLEGRLSRERIACEDDRLIRQGQEGCYTQEITQASMDIWEIDKTSKRETHARVESGRSTVKEWFA